MMHKIRSVMGLRDAEHTLKNWIELDEGFFETVDIHRNKEEKTKRGRGSQKQTKVVVMIESEPNDSNDNPNRPDKKVGYLKMQVIEDLSAETISKELEKGIEKGTNSVSDKLIPMLFAFPYPKF